MDLKVSVCFNPSTCRMGEQHLKPPSSHTFQMPEFGGLCRTIFVTPKPQARQLHTAIGQVCGGEKASKVWTSLSSSLRSFSTQLFSRLFVQQDECFLGETNRKCALLSPPLHDSIHMPSGVGVQSSFKRLCLCGRTTYYMNYTLKIYIWYQYELWHITFQLFILDTICPWKFWVNLNS